MRKNCGFIYNQVIFIILLLLSSSGIIFGQNISERFEKLTISENFDSISTYWTTLANADNLFIVQDGEYILQRRATTAPYAIIANFEEEFDNFRAVTSIKLDKTMGENASIGLLFMMQEQGQGGFIIEINKQNEYRLRQIVNGVYRYITGTSKDGGWIKSSSINDPNFSNMIEIKSFNKTYELSINGTFQRSFAEPSYSKGKMGLIIGPDSRGKVDFMYVFTKASPVEVAATNQKTNDPSGQPAPDLIELVESIITLKTQINVLQESNDELNRIISAMKSGDQEKDVTVRNFEKQIKNLEDQNKAKEASIDSLKKINTELLRYKEIVGGNDNGDIVINLSKALKLEKEKTQRLESELRDLKAKPGSSTPGAPKDNTKNDKNGQSSGSNGTNTKKDTNVYTLPQDK